MKPLLEGAIARSPTERSSYLDEACGADESLRAELMRVLEACESARDSLEFLDSPAVELAAPLLELEAESLTATGDLVPGVEVGPYILERYLGAGGMGVVYLARDPRLDRRVALKLLPAWLPVGEETSQRLTREARATSRLDHPNIQTVYEIGRTPDERPFIAMAYYDGETLKERISRGRIDVDVALELSRQIADGLGAAHEHGIVHKDVKPGNVIVTPEGVAKVLDFGAAEIAGREVDDGSPALGTIGYMSPEQTRAEEVDARTDVWSFGVLVHEMLTGRRPFTGRGAEAVIQSIRRDEPEALASLRPDVPDAVAGLVRRCLEKNPGDRFRDATALSEELRRITGDVQESKGHLAGLLERPVPLVAALAVTVLLGTSLLFLGRPMTSTDGAVSALVEPAVTRVAVLPVSFSSGTEEDEYFEDALTEELIAGLSRARSLRVTALSSVLPYKGTTEPARDIARALDVEAVLMNSIRRSGADVHLMLRLLTGASGEEHWAEEYVTTRADLPAFMRVVTEEAAAALSAGAEVANGRAMVAASTDDDEALDLYYRGRHFLQKLATPGAAQEARTYFERALDLDPTFAAAWNGLAGAYHQQAIQMILPARDAEPRAREAAERALELDPDLAEAHTHLGSVLSWYDWDAAAAERHFRRAIELDPSSARTHRFFSVHLRNQGRFEEALQMVRAGAELDPLSPGALAQEGEILYMARRYEESLAKLRQLLTVEPTYTGSYFFVALANVQLGRFGEALDALDLSGRNVNRDAIRGYALALQGRRDEAHRVLAALDSLPTSGVVQFNKAVLHVGLGELDTALDLLEMAIEDRPWQMQLLGVEPSFDPVRPDPRFQALLDRLDLPG